MFPSICLAPYFNRSQAHTYAIAAAKKTMVHMANTMSRISPAPRRRRVYQAPCFWPNHQTSPIVAVFCSFFSSPGSFVRKNG
jgi:hypothetical protein